MMIRASAKVYWTILFVWFVHLGAFFYCIQDKFFATLGALVSTFCIAAGLMFVENHSERQ